MAGKLLQHQSQLSLQTVCPRLPYLKLSQIVIFHIFVVADSSFQPLFGTATCCHLHIELEHCLPKPMQFLIRPTTEALTSPEGRTELYVMLALAAAVRSRGVREGWEYSSDYSYCGIHAAQLLYYNCASGNITSRQPQLGGLLCQA